MENALTSQKKKYQDHFRDKHLKTFETFRVNVALAYRLVENLKEFPASTESESKELFINVHHREVTDELKQDFRRWIILAGFDELFRWIKELLLDYLLLKEAFRKESLPDTFDEFEKLKSSLYQLHIPELIKKCRDYLGELKVLANYEKYNKARNALHHSSGVLVKRFCDKGKDSLEISGRRIALISENESCCAEIGPDGVCLENGAVKVAGMDFCIKRNLNDKIDFSLKEFDCLKDLGIFLYCELAQDLFGADDKPVLRLNLKGKIVKAKQAGANE